MNLTCIDAFCGAGGLSLGLTRAGIDVVYAFDNDPLSVQTYNLNKKHLQHAAEIRDATGIDSKELLSRLDLDVGQLFLLAGGPPCQGFSVQRIGADEDDRNDLVLAYARLIDDIQPKFFLMENVPGLSGKRGASVLSSFLHRIADSGYHPHSEILNAEDFGVPQRRRRIFVLGVRNDLYRRAFEFTRPQRTSANGRTTVEQTIGELPPPPPDGSDHPQIPQHRADRLSKVNLARIRALEPGQGMEHLPEELLAECHKLGPDKIGHRNVYGRMSWNDVAPTITARFDSFTRGKFGHPTQDRSITLREGALLQTFPMDFEFSGNKVEIARQIGNAVPPKLAEAVGRMIIAYDRNHP